MRIGIIGKGKMGTLLAQTAVSMGHEVVASVDIHDAEKLTSQRCDVVIDFSHRDNLPWVIQYVQATSCALVYGTTGLSESDMDQLHQLSQSCPVFYSANYSYGVAALCKILKLASSLLKEDFDMEIVEAHHNQKQDAPSGTAKMLLDILDPDHAFEHVYGRQGVSGKRNKEIGIHALRGGTVAGQHTVYFFGQEEIIEISHTANSRQIFVNGALKASEFITKKQAGFYTMDDLMEE